MEIFPLLILLVDMILNLIMGSYAHGKIIVSAKSISRKHIKNGLLIDLFILTSFLLIDHQVVRTKSLGQEIISSDSKL